MFRLSLKLRIVLVVSALLLVSGPSIISSAYNNMGSMALSKRLKAADRGDIPTDSKAVYQDEIGYFAEAVYWDRSHTRAYYNLGTVYLLMGDYKRAVSFLSMARGLGADDSLASLRLAQAYDKLGLGE